MNPNTKSWVKWIMALSKLLRWSILWPIIWGYLSRPKSFICSIAFLRHTMVLSLLSNRYMKSSMRASLWSTLYPFWTPNWIVLWFLLPNLFWFNSKDYHQKTLRGRTGLLSRTPSTLRTRYFSKRVGMIVHLFQMLQVWLLMLGLIWMMMMQSIKGSPKRIKLET